MLLAGFLTLADWQLNAEQNQSSGGLCQSAASTLLLDYQRPNICGELWL